MLKNRITPYIKVYVSRVLIRHDCHSFLFLLNHCSAIRKQMSDILLVLKLLSQEFFDLPILQ